MTAISIRALRKTLEGHGDAVVAVAIAAETNLVASGSLDKTVRLWDGGVSGACQARCRNLPKQ